LFCFRELEDHNREEAEELQMSKRRAGAGYTLFHFMYYRIVYHTQYTTQIENKIHHR